MKKIIKMKVQANAKLNLTLNVYPKCGRYHPIDSLVCSVDVFDVVEVTLRNDGKICVEGVDIAPEKNTAYIAAAEFQKTFGVCGCDIKIKKSIPIGAGMGGSSADAAAVVFCLCKLHNVAVDSAAVHETCARIGSDVNFMLRGGFARMTGKGDDLHFAVLPRELYFAVTTFDEQVSAKDAYDMFDVVGSDRESDNDRIFKLLQKGEDCLQLFGNGLQKGVSKRGYAEDYLHFCDVHKLNCMMTGSGSAYFVACKTQSEAQKTAELLHGNGFKTVVCKSVGNGISVLF